MRQFARAGLAASLFLSVLAMPVSAAGGPPVNDFFGNGAYSFVDRGVEWSGFLSVIDDRLNGVQRGAVSFGRLGAERVCFAGTPDEYVANDSIEFFGEKVSIDLKFRDDLSSSVFELRAIGHKSTYDACTGDIVSSRLERHTFDGKFTGTGQITTEVNDVDVLMPDGSIVPGTQTNTYRSADARLVVDRIEAVMTDVTFEHTVTLPN